MAAQTNSPIPLKRLEQIANDVCNSVFEGVEFYEHPKTSQWNETIINKMLKAVISEATPQGSTVPTYKFAVNSTIVQHIVPTSQINKPVATTSEDGTTTNKKGQAGRRGMHSATGGYWNEKTDGMWSFKWDGEGKGLDVVIMLIWIAV
ncbi:putative dynein light chain protein [Thermochaetoides thermophila DSM 1495]|uniref:Putative dynein light chain protein n=1 Tax=Chaetomium thermophilum (strain DSM 1495 / CBS 144.50 / IMI 039719) TaxID=759272 RepID=G0S9H8_CHATD|nr:putative dynein light chain protein [Thermochaetoides thermophila DSM 1495]EGS20089.1 putative dynein light chain protein [Thermochaetoides thermophila DSM 1495]